MFKGKGSTFVNILLLAAVIAIGVYFGIKYAGKPTVKVLVGQGENAKNLIDKANAAKDTIDRATKAAEEAMKKNSEQ